MVIPTAVLLFSPHGERRKKIIDFKISLFYDVMQGNVSSLLLFAIVRHNNRLFHAGVLYGVNNYFFQIIFDKLKRTELRY